MKTLTILSLILLTSLTFATDIKLKDGTIITNIEISKETDAYIEFRFNDAKRRVPKSEIENIRILPVNLARPASKIEPLEQSDSEMEVIGHYQPTYLLPAAAVSFLIGFSFLSDASDLDDIINAKVDYSDLGLPDYLTDALEKGQKFNLTDTENKSARYKIIGYGSIIAGGILTYLSFKTFDIYATPNKVGVEIKF